MKKRLKIFLNKSTLKNQKGFLTINFLFATIISFSFVALLLVFSITFSTTSLLQYISFSTARTLFAGDLSSQVQFESAQIKYQSFIDPQTPDKRFLRALFSGGWFEVPSLEGLQLGFSENYQEHPKTRKMFYGAGLYFKIPVLQGMRIPFLEEKADNQKDLGAYIFSFLGREPSTEECFFFIQNRVEQIFENHTNEAWSSKAWFDHASAGDSVRAKVLSAADDVYMENGC